MRLATLGCVLSPRNSFTVAFPVAQHRGRCRQEKTWNHPLFKRLQAKGGESDVPGSSHDIRVITGECPRCPCSVEEKRRSFLLGWCLPERSI